MADNSNLTKVPISELTEANLEALKGPQTARTKRSSHKSRQGLMIAIAAIFVVGLGIVLYFLLRPNNSQNPNGQSISTDPDIVWETRPDAVDPGAEYTQQLQATLEDPDSAPSEKLQSKIQLANLETAADDFSAAEARLNAIDRANLTHRQLFNLYNAYTYLYERSGDKVKHTEYAKLVEEILGQYWGEEEE